MRHGSLLSVTTLSVVTLSHPARTFDIVQAAVRVLAYFVLEFVEVVANSLEVQPVVVGVDVLPE